MNPNSPDARINPHEAADLNRLESLNPTPMNQNYMQPPRNPEPLYQNARVNIPGLGTVDAIIQKFPNGSIRIVSTANDPGNLRSFGGDPAHASKNYAHAQIDPPNMGLNQQLFSLGPVNVQSAQSLGGIKIAAANNLNTLNNPQNFNNIQNLQTFSSAQNQQNLQNFVPAQNFSSAQNPQNLQNFSPAQNIQLSQNFSNAQNPQNFQNFSPAQNQNLQNQQNFQNLQNLQNFSPAQNIPNAQTQNNLAGLQGFGVPPLQVIEPNTDIFQKPQQQMNFHQGGMGMQNLNQFQQTAGNRIDLLPQQRVMNINSGMENMEFVDDFNDAGFKNFCKNLSNVFKASTIPTTDAEIISIALNQWASMTSEQKQAYTDMQRISIEPNQPQRVMGNNYVSQEEEKFVNHPPPVPEQPPAPPKKTKKCLKTGCNRISEYDEHLGGFYCSEECAIGHTKSIYIKAFPSLKKVLT